MSCGGHQSEACVPVDVNLRGRDWPSLFESTDDFRRDAAAVEGGRRRSVRTNAGERKLIQHT